MPATGRLRSEPRALRRGVQEIDPSFGALAIDDRVNVGAERSEAAIHRWNPLARPRWTEVLVELVSAAVEQKTAAN